MVVEFEEGLVLRDLQADDVPETGISEEVAKPYCYNFLFSFLYYITYADSPPLFPLFLTLCHHCDSILVTLHQGLAHDAK